MMRTGLGSFVAVVVLSVVALWSDRLHAAEESSAYTSTVGIPQRLEQIVLPGPRLEAKPVESRKVPVIVRIIATYPHGTAFRYDLEYYTLEPGKFDLRNYLQRADKTPATDLAPIPIVVESLLAPGQILPTEVPAQPHPWLGGYRWVMALLGLAWVAGIFAILFAKRARPIVTPVVDDVERPVADRLRPLVLAAQQRPLTTEEAGELERLLLSYWREKLELRSADPRQAIAEIRRHPEAGALLRQIEAWVHAPHGREADVRQLLAPYGQLKAGETNPPEPALRAASAASTGAAS